MTTIKLVTIRKESERVPLGVLGYCLKRSDFLAPVWSKLELPMKEVEHTPSAKLQDVLTGILAGCRSLYQTNTRLRPDLVLAQAWGRERFAEQSMLSRTLDAFDEENVEQLRLGSEQLFQRESAVLRHDFSKEWLWLDIDLTPLPCSKQAEGGTKGKFDKKTPMADR